MRRLYTNVKLKIDSFAKSWTMKPKRIEWNSEFTCTIIIRSKAAKQQIALQGKQVLPYDLAAVAYEIDLNAAVYNPAPLSALDDSLGDSRFINTAADQITLLYSLFAQLKTPVFLRNYRFLTNYPNTYRCQLSLTFNEY